jgi:hypothetical protein
MSQQLSKQEMTVSQILRTYGKQFTQIKEQYSDGLNARCALGVIMSYYGWNGKDGPAVATRLLATLVALRHEGFSRDSIIRLNDAGSTFDQIADYVDQCHELANGES